MEADTHILVEIDTATAVVIVAFVVSAVAIKGAYIIPRFTSS